jgi:glucokinase
MDREQGERPLLVGDIGGTNARFGILRRDSKSVEHIDLLPCADFPSLSEAIEAYLARHKIDPPFAASIAVATPVTSDTIRMTNHVWRFSIEETRRRVELERLLVLNDFTALAMSLPQLQPGDFHQVGSGKAELERPIALLGPGTGLGVSGLIPSATGWIPLQTEGGHVTLPSANERQQAIVNYLWGEYPHISAERLLSGPGLVLLHRTIAVLNSVPVEVLSPDQISQRGLAGECDLCSEALTTFCRMLGTVAGNLALTLGARGGVYLGGGIVPQLGGFFATSGFRQAFEQHGRFSDYLAAIPTYVITAPYPALAGAAEAFYSSQPGIGMMSQKNP